MQNSFYNDYDFNELEKVKEKIIELLFRSIEIE